MVRRRAAGDFTGDGHADLRARVPSGTLFVFKSAGKAGTSAFPPWREIGTGWSVHRLPG